MRGRGTKSNHERLDAIVAEYKRVIAPRRQKALARFRAMPDLETAIRIAALAVRDDGKMESHQCRVGRVALRRFERALQRRRAMIEAVTSFDELYQLLWSARARRVGRLTVYDTAIRIGRHLGLEPKAVYVHAGAAKGARELRLPIVGGCVEIRQLPPALRRLAPDEVEDCLCIYKGRFHRSPSLTGAGACNATLRRRSGGPC